MNKEERIILTSNKISCSSIVEDVASMYADFIICDFNVNGNDVMLNKDTVDNWSQTLVSSPLVGKIDISNDDGTADFTSHNLNPSIRTSEDGEVYLDEEFGTHACGTFTSVQRKIINNKEYLVATAKIWKRFPNFCAVIKRRLRETAFLSTSWELLVKSSHDEIQNGKKVKVIDDGIFIGHCLLGEKVLPAFKDSCLLNVASENSECSEDILVKSNELRNALTEDILSISQNIVSKITKEREEFNLSNITKETEGLEKKVVTDTSSEDISNNVTGKETSALTAWDLEKALKEAVASKLGINKYDFYGFYHFPTEKTYWVKKYNDKSQLDITKFTYEVENDVVTVSEPIKAKLTLSISEMESEIAKLNTEISKKNEVVIKADETIKALNKEISELNTYKEKFEVAEQERIQKEVSEQKEALKKYALKGGYITEAEIETSEDIKGFIENLDKANIQSIIADRATSALDSVSKKSKEVDEVKENVVGSVNLSNFEEEDMTSRSKTLISAYIGK